MKHLLSLAASLLFGAGAIAQVTFNVDMTYAPSDFDNVFVTGPWCGWCANDTYNTMTDPDGDGIYSVEVADLAGTVEYKYAINGFADQENLVNDMVDGATCAPITDYSGYANRTIEAGSVDQRRGVLLRHMRRRCATTWRWRRRRQWSPSRWT